MQLTVVLSFVALVASASAAAIPKPTVASALTKRQTDACALFCEPLKAAGQSCGSDATCICSGTVAALMYTCGTCGYQQDPTNYTQLQQMLDQYSASCQNTNSPVGALSIPTCTASASGSATTTTTNANAAADSSTA
ncbi:hypothetical protein FRB90_004279 [Tulasnella sp. 427]|nr:hypothetical protein FRB90_004279 [Tulasnella sp. 427]